MNKILKISLKIANYFLLKKFACNNLQNKQIGIIY